MVEAFPGDSLEHLRVLYVSSLAPDYYGEYRLRALKRLRLGHVAAVDTGAFTGLSGIAGKLQFRLQAGPDVTHLNHAILESAKRERANVLLCDKVLSLQPATLRKLRQSGVVTVDYVIDNPFGPRRDPGWRLYRRTIPLFDLIGVQRDVSIADYRRKGAREVVRIRTSYEPTVHYPPSAAPGAVFQTAAPGAVYQAGAPASGSQASWSDSNRDRRVSFIGTPYDHRGDFLTRLWRGGALVDVSGSRPHWQAALPPDAFAAIFRHGELKGAAYREAIWRSRINLAFVTHSNRDQVAHKSFEIAACGGFLLAERTPEHLACFREEEEAVFFSDFEECRAKIDRYLNDETARGHIAAAGRRRAQSSGYDNDSVLKGLLVRAAELLATGASTH
jgi:hypothetical protein